MFNYFCSFDNFVVKKLGKPFPKTYCMAYYWIDIINIILASCL